MLYEGFNYTPGTALTNAPDGPSGGWAGRWTGVNVPLATNLAGNLNYTDASGNPLPTSGGSVVVGNLAGSTINAQVSRSFAIGTLNGNAYTGLSNGTYWVSFMMRWIGYPTPNTMSTSNRFWRKGDLAFRSGALTNASTTGTELLAVGRPNANQFPQLPIDTWTLWSGGDGGAAASGVATIHPLTNASFILLRLDLDNTSALDTAYLWVNWTNLLIEPAPATAQATNALVNLTGLNNIRIDANNQNASGTNTVIQFDEFRLGTTFADVTLSNSVQSLLVITNVVLSSNVIGLAGKGGPLNGIYRVIATTNLAQPASAWRVVGTNVFDANGNFSSNHPRLAGAPQEYFCLLLGGTLPPMPVAPIISSQPTNLTVAVTENASFHVTATGTSPLRYQWYLNPGTVLAGATNSSLTISNAQFTNGGAYFVVVTNIAGSATSTLATLTVVSGSAPSITVQPQHLTNSAGLNAAFTVNAIGTATLRYRWYYNSTNLVSGATNAWLTLANLQPQHAGGYSVVVSNNFGATTSLVAMLTVAPSNSTPDFGLWGFATVGGNTTGGAGGTPVTVTTQAALQSALNQVGPMVISVSGTINIGNTTIRDRSNKTILGLGTNAALVGNFQFQNCTNMIVRNLHLSYPGGSDGMTIQDFSERIWVDHCTFSDCGDGQLDITHGSSYITVSWCKFSYTTNQTTHRFCSLVGHADDNAAEDVGRLRITYHHNWWSTLVTERMPRLRFGQVHLFNNYYNAPGNNYCAAARLNSEMLIEENYFHNVRDPWEQETGGKIRATGNTLVNTTGTTSPGTDEVFTPPYSYNFHPVGSVPTLIMTHAGAGSGPFAP